MRINQSPERLGKPIATLRGPVIEVGQIGKIIGGNSD
jgi:hypothetical protein